MTSEYALFSLFLPSFSGVINTPCCVRASKTLQYSVFPSLNELGLLGCCCEAHNVSSSVWALDKKIIFLLPRWLANFMFVAKM